jgi:vacuolar-type H+-ATPase subunit H
MEDVIKRIITIENKAQKVINMAEQEKINKRNDLTDKLKALEEKLNNDANRKIQQLRDRELSEAKEIAADAESMGLSTIVFNHNLHYRICS